MNYQLIVKKTFLIVLLILGFNACSFKVSLNGSSIHPDAKTISIQTFSDDAGTGPPDLNQRFTEKLKTFFQRNTRLTLVDSEGDLQFDGMITTYDVSPVSPSANEDQSASLQRLTIEVKTEFINKFDEKSEFDEGFSQFEDFPANQNIQDVEDELIDVILDRIVFDIFNKSSANW